MKPADDPARTVPATGVWEGFGQWSRALAVPGAASAVAARRPPPAGRGCWTEVSA